MSAVERANKPTVKCVARKASCAEQANEKTVPANELTDEQMTQYLNLNSRWFWATVE